MASFNISPSVKVTETDLSGVLPAVATSTAVVVGRAQKGMAFKRVLVPNDQRLVDEFGIATDDNYKPFFSALGYLSQGQNLYYTRTTATSSQCATVHLDIQDSTTIQTSGSDGEAIFVPGSGVTTGFNPDDVDSISNIADIDFVAIGPGDYYDDYKISIVDKTTWETLTNPTSATYYFDLDEASGGYKYHEYLVDLDVGPQTTDEFGVFVVKDVREEGATAPTYSVQESYLVSTTKLKKDGDGQTVYVENRINERSGLMRVRADDNLTTSPHTVLAKPFTDGSDGPPTDATYLYAWDLYKNPETVDVSILVDADSSNTVKIYLNTLAEYRKDCVAILDIPYAQYNDSSVSTTISNLTTWRNDTLAINSSYSALYANYFRIYDKYNDKKRWVPVSGFQAGLMAATDYNAESWYPTAGVNRGVVSGISEIKLETEKSDRDQLYTHGINPVINYRGGGAVVWGQKTLLKKSSSFNRLNVRRLFIVLEKTIATYAEQIIFEFNDEFTRNLFTSLINPFLIDVQNKRGIYEFKTIVDTSNNTALVIDANGFVADIYIKPARAAEFINLNFYSTRTGQSFEELIGG